MMKKISLLTLTFISFLFVGMMLPTVYAAGETVALTLNVVKLDESDEVQILPTTFDIQFGQTASLDLTGLETETNEIVLLHNNDFVDNDQDFLLSGSLNVSVIIKNDANDIVAAFVDSNGELLDVVYNPVEAPTTLAQPTKPGYEVGTFTTTEITSDTVFVANYVRSSTTPITVNVVGGTKDKEEYLFNDIVTVDTDLAGFTHWEDEAGNIVSYQETFSFSALDNITLTASTSGISKPNIYMRNVSGIRSGYDSLLAYIETGSNHNIIEYGYLVSHLEGPVLTSETQKIPSQSLSQRNEFLRSFIEDEYNQFIAYATLMNTMTDEITTIYSNGYYEYELNITVDSPAYTPERIYIAGNMNGWNTNSNYIDKVEGSYSKDFKVLAKQGDILNYKLLSGTSWQNEAFYTGSRTGVPSNRTHTFSQDLQVNLTIIVNSWKTLPINSTDSIVEPGSFRVYFFVPWANINTLMRIHYFDQTPSTGWPGVNMIYSQGGYFYYDVPSSTGSFGIVFNDSENQSVDLIFNQNAPYYYYTYTSDKWEASTWNLT